LRKGGREAWHSSEIWSTFIAPIEKYAASTTFGGKDECGWGEMERRARVAKRREERGMGREGRGERDGERGMRER
jgi:hypothetical protein